MNGRNFEYFGEDPFLASRMAVQLHQRRTEPGSQRNSQTLLGKQLRV